jgi:hypothetical protein
MQIIRTKELGALIALLIVIGLAPASISAAPDGDQKEPELPSPLCDRLKVEAGNKVHSHVYATGTQIYRWDGLSWVLLSRRRHVRQRQLRRKSRHSLSRTHLGKQQRQQSGRVASLRVHPGCDRHPLVTTRGGLDIWPGHIQLGEFVQRVNTTGGLPPAYPGLVIGQMAKCHTAEYYFYGE